MKIIFVAAVMCQGKGKKQTNNGKKAQLKISLVWLAVMLTYAGIFSENLHLAIF